MRDRREHTARISPVVDCICRICKRRKEEEEKTPELTTAATTAEGKKKKKKKNKQGGMHQHDRHTRETGADGMKKPESLSLALSSTVHTYIVCVCLFYPDSLIRFSSFVCAQHRGNIWRRRSPTKTLSDQLLVHVPQRVTTFLPPLSSSPPLVYSNLISNESTGVSRLITQPNARFQLLSLGIFHEIEWNKTK